MTTIHHSLSSSSLDDSMLPNAQNPLSRPSIFKLPIRPAKDLTIKKSQTPRVVSRDESSSSPSRFSRNKRRTSTTRHSAIPSIFSPQSESPIKPARNDAQNENLFNIIITRKIKLDDITSRTYFSQLISALEALHSQGKAHLNLNLENLLLNEHFALKISDEAQRENVNYRAPEVLEGDLSNPQAGDIYSLGIILFTLKTGHLPYEDFEGIDMKELARTNKHIYWKNLCKASFFGYDFRKLFMGMADPNPLKRPSFEEIKGSVWCSKHVYDDQELCDSMKKRVESSI